MRKASARTHVASAQTDTSARFMGIATAILFTGLLTLNVLAY